MHPAIAPAQTAKGARCWYLLSKESWKFLILISVYQLHEIKHPVARKRKKEHTTLQTAGSLHVVHGWVMTSSCQNKGTVKSDGALLVYPHTPHKKKKKKTFWIVRMWRALWVQHLKLKLWESPMLLKSAAVLSPTQSTDRVLPAQVS